MNYNLIYESIINRAKTRTANFAGEWHHSIPKCMGGDDRRFNGVSGNKVKLTYREHLFAHRLLCRMYPHQTGLAYALVRMTCKYKSDKQGQKLSSLYEADRKRIAEMLSTIHKGKTITSAHREAARKFHLGRKQPNRVLTDEGRIRLGHRKGIPCPDHVREAVIKANTGRIKSQEEKNKIGTAHKGKVMTDESRVLMSQKSGGRKWVHKDNVSKRVKIDEIPIYMQQGFSLGR